MEPTESYETSAYNNRLTPWTYPKEKKLQSKHGESLKSGAVIMLDTPCSGVVWRVLATHSIRQFPLHFPSHASPCAITFQLESNTADGDAAHRYYQAFFTFRMVWGFTTLVDAVLRPNRLIDMEVTGGDLFMHNGTTSFSLKRFEQNHVCRISCISLKSNINNALDATITVY